MRRSYFPSPLVGEGGERSEPGEGLLRWGVADGLDIVAVAIEHERAVIIGMIMRPEARRSVVLPARCERCAIEGIYLRARARGEGDVDALIVGGAEAFADPEERLAVGAKADRCAASGLNIRRILEPAPPIPLPLAAISSIFAVFMS